MHANIMKIKDFQRLLNVIESVFVFFTIFEWLILSKRQLVMNIFECLHQNQTDIIRTAFDSLLRSNLKHYSSSSANDNWQRIEKLFDLTSHCIKEKNLVEMIEYSEKIAAERYNTGYDLHEVHAAYNVLEEAIWGTILKNLEPKDFGEALGLISTVLGAGKETLALTYISLTGKKKPESLDLSELFKGN